MSKLDLTVKGNYVDWTTWEAIRELLQNAKDAEEAEGAPMDIQYFPQTERLEITNEGVTMDRKRLVLGSTSKTDDPSQRGQFGEGFKLAFATLCRLDKPVVMDVGEERWRPALERSEQFDNEELLRIEARKLRKPRNHVKIEVKNLRGFEWREIKRKVLFVDEDPDLKAQTPRGTILDDPEQSGIYSQGLFINSRIDTVFSYDIPDLEVDRDRRMVREYDVKPAVAEIIEQAWRLNRLEGEEIYRIIEDGSSVEARALGEKYSRVGDEFDEAIVDHFKQEHGDNAVAVRTTSQSKEASYYGLEGIPTSSELAGLLERAGEGLEEAIENRQMEVERRYGWHELDSGEKQNLEDAREAVERIVGDLDVSVVDFPDASTLGRASEQSIEIARRIIGDRVQLLATLAHEAAHLDGTDDFTVEHRNATETLLASIAAQSL